MNADLLKNNPSWTTYFYLVIPMSLLVMLAVLWLKRKKLLDIWHSQSLGLKLMAGDVPVLVIIRSLRSCCI